VSTAGPIPWVNDSGLDETQRAASEFLRPSQGLQAKLRRRLARLTHRRPATVALDRPILCFTFDDVLSSAATTGAHILESYGARGTYFVSASFTGREGLIGRFATRDELLAAAAAGHELACHTYSHLNCGGRQR
jgi:peptidoglycan/xylan/chitin deacetylase (PgdA/CDA1 family)